MLALEARTTVGEIELDVELDVSAGAPLALAGPSGAGKTTVLRIAAGLTKPGAGRVACGDELWLDTALGVDEPPERRRCGFVFQGHALFPHLSAWRNVAYAGCGQERAVELLERFGVAHRAEARPDALSGGERQRVALARALAADPRALLLDEPLAALDTRTRTHAARELATVLPTIGVPAVVVTHDFAEASLLAGEVAVLEAGRIVQRAPAGELAATPASGFVADFTGAVVLTGVAAPGPSGLTRVDLDGGGTVVSVDALEGPVAVSVHPWEIALERWSAEGSAQNRLPVRVTSLTTIGNRARIGLAAPQPLAAEITTESASRLELEPGQDVFAVWKATATRLTAR